MSEDGNHLHPVKVTLLAPAKVNLFLHITGRRPDGYHEIESLFVRTDFGDTITVIEADELSLEITGPFSKGLLEVSPELNLVTKAAKLLLEQHIRPVGARITLTKNLPLSSGIGGGSADAAATLLCLKRLWQVDISDAELGVLALEVGADVPACLSHKPQWVSGIGEQCREVKLGYEKAILLVNPLAESQTEDVFKTYISSGVSFQPKLAEQEKILTSCDSLNTLTYNRLFDPARLLCPVIDDVINALNDVADTSVVRMSGSGATSFALFDSLSKAREAAQSIRTQKPNWWVMPGNIII